MQTHGSAIYGDSCNVDQEVSQLEKQIIELRNKAERRKKQLQVLGY